MFHVMTLNSISPAGLRRLPKENYEVGPDIKEPDAILVRSFNMHGMKIPAALKAVGRVGTGVNTIPVGKLSEKGIPVFNAPGANANAVKELVIAGLLLACRNICLAWDYTRNLKGDDAEIRDAVELGKKKFAGTELPGTTIGVVGLGAIGRSVANLCLNLGMKVIGYDPKLTVEGAWQLSSSVECARSLEALMRKVDFITFHVPLTKGTQNMINAKMLGIMKEGVVILNFARDGIIDDKAVCDAINDGRVRTYVCDFPSSRLIHNENVVVLPHLGASTREAEDNCAVMVAEQIRDFLENGNIRNSVNFPEVAMPRGTSHRLVVANANVPNMLGQVSTTMAEAGLNIHDMINQSRGDFAYTVVDSDSPIPLEVAKKIATITGVTMARVL